jgi:hypothetical protein
MDTNLKSAIPQSDQTRADGEQAASVQGQAPAFHVQTGIRAGGFFENFQSWWQGVSDGFNAFDRSTGAGG